MKSSYCNSVKLTNVLRPRNNMPEKGNKLPFIRHFHFIFPTWISLSGLELRFSTNEKLWCSVLQLLHQHKVNVRVSTWFGNHDFPVALFSSDRDLQQTPVVKGSSWGLGSKVVCWRESRLTHTVVGLTEQRWWCSGQTAPPLVEHVHSLNWLNTGGERERGRQGGGGSWIRATGTWRWAEPTAAVRVLIKDVLNTEN